MPGFQAWTTQNDVETLHHIRQTTNTFAVSYSFRRAVSVSLLSTQGSTFYQCVACNETQPESEPIRQTGIADTQLSIGYRIPQTDFVVSTLLNLPTGNPTLSAQTLPLATFQSNQVLALRMPQMGQGFGAQIGISGAFQLTDLLVLGGGFSYQKSGGFQPLDTFMETYHPGAEWTADLGGTLRIGERGTWGFDVLGTQYQTDTFADAPVFKAGRKLALTSQFRYVLDNQEFGVYARYRSREKNTIAQFLGDEMMPESTNSNPAVSSLKGLYRFRLNPAWRTTITADYRSYATTSAVFSGSRVFGLGIEPDFQLSERFSMPVRLRLQRGTMRNEAFSADPIRLSSISLLAGLAANF